LNGKTGVFPSNFVQVVEELEPSVKTEHIPGMPSLVPFGPVVSEE
jgi:hypothetical protein